MKIEKKVLKNGLTIILLPIPESESVVFTVFIKVGSRYETAETSGVAHFLEHLLFKGSQNYPNPSDMQTAIDEIGGDFNAATSKESTEYYIKAQKDSFDLVFNVLTDMVQNPLFHETEIRKEQSVVIEEMNLYKDNPSWQIYSDLDKVMWQNSTLGWDVIGTRESVSSLNREKIFKFKESFYQPNNIVLGISGAFEPKQALKKIEDHWSKLKRKRVPSFAAVRDGQKRPRFEMDHRTTQQAHFALGFKSFEHNHKDNPAVLLLSSILGGSTSSRLWINIREQKGLAYSIYASNTAYYGTGNFSIVAGVRTESALDAIRAIMTEIRRVKSDLVSEIELNRSKNYIKGKMALALEDNQDKLDWIMERFAFSGKIVTPEEYLERIQAVTAEQIQRVANEIFRNQRMGMALIGPFKNKNEFAKELHLKENF